MPTETELRRGRAFRRLGASGWLARLTRILFPPADFPRVADIAGGRGSLSTALIREGFKVTLIDPAPGGYTLHRCKGRRVLRPSRHSNVPKGVKLRRKRFLVRHADDFDVLVGAHPCGASKKLVRAARQRPVILVPCWCRSVWNVGPRSTVELARGEAPRRAEAYIRETGLPYELLRIPVRAMLGAPIYGVKVFLIGEQAMAARARHGNRRGV